MADPDTPARRRRTRPWRGLTQRSRTAAEVVIFVVVLFFLGWGTDTLARYGAESLLARNIQNATGAAERPIVHVRGFAFVPQVVRGAYNEVDVQTRGTTSGPLRVEQVDSQLLDVRVPFHDVLVQDIRQVGIGRSIEDVTLLYADLNAYFDATGRPLQVAAGADGGVRMTGSVDILGRRVTASADVVVSASDAILRLTPRKIDTGGSTLDQASRLLLNQRLRLSVPLGTLPFGHKLTSATPYAEGIHMTAEGRAVILTP
jgi:hypothetical protein